MPRVFVVNKGGHDLSAALRYGEPIIYMSDGSVNRFALANMYRQFAGILNESDPDDLLLLTGLTNLCVVASACFAYKHGRVNWLLFKDGRYIKRTIVLSELLERSIVQNSEHTLKEK